MGYMRQQLGIGAALALALLTAAACSEDKTAANSDAGHTAQSSNAPTLSGGASGKPASVQAVSASAGHNGSKPNVAAAAPAATSSDDAGQANPTPKASSGLPEVYVCQALLAAQPPNPSGMSAEGSSCCADRGSCQRLAAITLDMKASLGHDKCNGDLVCAPTTTTAAKTCHAQTGAASLEGRCLPRCFLLGDPGALLLTSADCAADEACGACFDPVTSKATGACTQAGDQPKEPAPAAWKPCGTYQSTGPSAGVCMPKVLARASKNSVVDLLPQDICSDSEVCMPNLKAANYTACFTPCDTSALVTSAGSKEGGCIPPYIAAFSNADAVPFLEQGKCAAGELCAPCLDPTKNNAVTGACN